jgi:hypothetical protein
MPATMSERLPYNLGMTGSSLRTDLNWVNNVMTWDLSSDNTNLATLTGASSWFLMSAATRASIAARPTRR